MSTMKIIEKEVKPFMKVWVCGKCDQGEMVSAVIDGTSNTIIFDNPPKLKHTCTHCGNVEWHTERYPSITYRYV